jgi:hypothetical protein
MFGYGLLGTLLIICLVVWLIGRCETVGDSLSDLKFVSRKEILLKTLDETDPEKLARLVPEAGLAMFKRRQELADSPQNSAELSTMPVAPEALRVVKRRITGKRCAEPLVAQRPARAT